MAAKKKQANPLRGKRANVSLSRNGLHIEIPDVPAADAARVGGILLSAVRRMVKAGYDELTLDAGGVHGGVLGEIPEDEYTEDGSDPPVAQKRIGFT